MKYTPNSNPAIVYRNIDNINNRYQIKKNNQLYASFKNLTDAVHERDILENIDWDLDLLVEQEHTQPTYTEEDLPPFPEANGNKRKLIKGRLGFYGASYINRDQNPWTRVWQTNISIKGHRTYLGTFTDPLSAQIVYLGTKQEIAGII